MSANKEREAAMVALDRISKRCGKTDICCGCPIPGHPGDGYLQPPDPPECCGYFENVDDLIAVVRAALPSTSTDGAQAGWIKPAKGMPPPWVTVLVETSCGHVTTGMHAPGIGWHWEPADDEDEDAVIAHWQPLPKPAPRSTHENE